MYGSCLLPAYPFPAVTTTGTAPPSGRTARARQRVLHSFHAWAGNDAGWFMINALTAAPLFYRIAYVRTHPHPHIPIATDMAAASVA